MFMDLGFNINLGVGKIGELNKSKLAKFKNWQTFRNVLSVRILDALEGRYDIIGLPSSCSKRVILQSLLWYGCVCFFEKEGALMALPCAPAGNGLNVYGDFGNVWVYGRNGMLNQIVDVYIPGSDECAFLNKTNGSDAQSNLKGVLIWENRLRMPFINITMEYAEKIADGYRTLDVARTHLKNPYIIFSEEAALKTVKEFLNKRDNNEAEIVSTGIFSVDKVKAIPLVTNGDNLNAVISLIEWYDNKYRELCGIDNNSNIDKKGENLIKAEVSINDEYTALSVEKIIPFMNEELEDVNRIFGTNISVKKKEIKVDSQQLENEEEPKDDNNENI